MPCAAPSAISTCAPSSTLTTTSANSPQRFHTEMDTRRWGPGERIVFEPYTKEVFEDSFQWIAQHNIFPEGEMGPGCYEDAVISVPA